MREVKTPPLVPLTELADVNPPRSISSLLPHNVVSFVPMGDVSENGRWTGRQSREYGSVQNGFTFFSNGDVLFAKITPCMENGKGCLVNGLTNSVGFGSTEFHVLRAKDEADPGYVYQWSIYDDLRRLAKTSMAGSAGQQRVPVDFFAKFLVPKFSKPEQTKIAEILSTVDRAIEQTEAAIKTQQRLKTGLMQDLLTRGIDEHGNLRSEATHQFKDSPLGRIPVEWEVRSLEECVDFLDGQRIPLKQEDREKMKGEFPYYGASGIIDYINRYIFNEDLILIGEDGENVVSRNLPLAFKVCGKIWVNNHAHVVRPKDGFDIDFLAERLDFYDYTLLVSGSAQPKLNQRSLKSLTVPIPPAREQTRIGRALIAVKQTRAIEAKTHTKLRSLKTALMQDLLTVRRRVTTLIEV